MNCKSFENEIMNRLTAAPEAVATSKGRKFDEHLAACPGCAEEMRSMSSTMELLDAWKAPEPSAYFDQKLAVLLREEQAKAPSGWLEKLRERFLFNTGWQFRPALAGALALVLLLGGGTLAGISNYHSSWLGAGQVEASATVNDLQILDKNEQAIQQMDQLLQDDDPNDSGAADQPAS